MQIDNNNFEGNGYSVLKTAALFNIRFCYPLTVLAGGKFLVACTDLVHNQPTPTSLPTPNLRYTGKD